MGEFACGITLCIGSINSTGADDAWNDWMKKFDDDPNTPTYAFIDALVDHDGSESAPNHLFDRSGEQRHRRNASIRLTVN